ncbi:MAG TPA: hypothetical protein VFT56_00840 [Sphingomonas sp.]|nr:hypothetical protein [Sphingomonas sp.]
MRRAAYLFPLALIGGCAANGDYPSLAPRPIEQTGEAVPIRLAPVATPDAALDAKIDALAKRLADADAAFGPAAGRARDLVAAAASSGIGSTAWLDAQTALAELDGYRAESTAAMSALDELAIARAAKLEPPYPALDNLHARGGAQVDAESATIAALQKQLPGS